MITRFLLLLFLVLQTALGFAAGPFFDEYGQSDGYVDDDAAVWQEKKRELPALPQEENLLAFDVDEPKRRFNYTIDRTSLVAGEDGVMRFSLVIESMSGVKNSSYEGIRCSTKEYKVYAYGSNGQFKTVRKPIWRRIMPRHLYYNALYLDYLCHSQGVVIEPLSPEQAVKSILTKTRRQEY
ncbi:MAG: CNP1-like family protein [Candidatus Polarisedimenticolaceae bacterium]|nr:CNP1-like family protein [Candidatus Polarisedimenticolaceae bacterium]